MGLERGHDLPGPADDQPLERLLLEVTHQRVARVLEVVVLLLLNPALVARLRPATLVVLPEHLVVDLLDLSEALWRASQDARVPAVHERHAPALTPLEPGQGTHQRGIPDENLVRDGTWQLQRLEEIRFLAAEHGDAVRSVGGQFVLEEVARTLKGGLESDTVLV